MPTRADWLAASPKCDRLRGPLSMRGPCAYAMHWVTLTSPTDGNWCCPVHGPMLSGVDAALRAGFLAYVYVEPEEAA